MKADLSNGQRYTAADFEKLAEDIRGNDTEGAAGRGTLKVAATIGTILREQADGRSWMARSGMGNGAEKLRTNRLAKAL